MSIEVIIEVVLEIFLQETGFQFGEHIDITHLASLGFDFCCGVFEADVHSYYITYALNI